MKQRLLPLLRSRVFRASLFLFGAFAIAWRLHLVGRAQYRVGMNAQPDYLLKYVPNAQALVLGSSHAAMVRLPSMGLLGENLWATGQDLFEVEYKAKWIVPRLPELETVMISVSYFSFASDNGAYEFAGQRPRDQLRQQMYAGYPYWKPISGDYENHLRGLFYAVITPDHWQKGLPHLFDLVTVLPPKLPMGTLNRPALNREGLVEYSRKRIGVYRHLIGVVTAAHPNLEEDSYQALERTVIWLQSRGLRVVLFTAPVWIDYYRWFPAPYRDAMSRRVEQLRQKTGVEYHDFARDPRFFGRPQWFSDSDHLTLPGQSTFSRYLGAAMGLSLPPLAQPPARPLPRPPPAPGSAAPTGSVQHRAASQSATSSRPPAPSNQPPRPVASPSVQGVSSVPPMASSLPRAQPR